MSRKPNPDTEAFVTLATNDPYAYGALVLGQSLRNVATTRKLAVLVTSQVTQPLRQQLTTVYDHVQQVDPLDSQDEAHLVLLTRPELGVTFTKIHCWTLTQYSKCVFLDSDCLVLRNVDELFDREELSAAPDIGWPDCFNSGVFVFRPSEETHRAILRCALTHGSFDGGDQGLLNTFFKDWSSKDISRHLPFIYNMTSSTGYSYLPAYFNFRHEIRIVHFIGPGKPWRYRYNFQNGQLQPPEGMNSNHDMDFIKKWWSIFTTHIKPRLERESGSQLNELNLEGINSVGSQSPRARQHAWERGEIDYLGKDGFDFILDQICSVFERDDVPGEETPPSNDIHDGQHDGKRTEDGGGKELEKEPLENASSPDEEKKQGKENGASPTEDEEPSSSNDNKGQNGNQMEIESPSDDKTSSKCPCVLL